MENDKSVKEKVFCQEKNPVLKMFVVTVKSGHFIGKKIKLSIKVIALTLATLGQCHRQKT